MKPNQSRHIILARMKWATPHSTPLQTERNPFRECKNGLVYSGLNDIPSIPELMGPLHSGRNDIADYILAGIKWFIPFQLEWTIIPAVVEHAVDQDVVQIPLVWGT